MIDLKKRPLGRSIAFGCILFTAILCVGLSVLSYFDQKNALRERFGVYVSDLLHYVDAHIDDEDLTRCIETGQESPAYKETLRFMDEIMIDYSIHSLYVIKPLNHNETGNVMVVLSAENEHNRNVDTEGNLKPGRISTDEYDTETVKKLFEIMEQDEVAFFMEETAWGTDYTGALPLRDRAGNSYAVLAVDVDATEETVKFRGNVTKNIVVIAILGCMYTAVFLLWTKRNITHPVRQLEKGVVAYASQSHGQRSVEALKFQAPQIRPENEVKSLSRAITQMTVDMQDYVSEMLSAEEQSRSMRALADQMSELAVADTLTGIRNKNAFSIEIKKLEQELSDNRELHFGIAMVDLNYLKRINDTFGHEKGDEALRGAARLICGSFPHSPVFRVGGDEFVVILRGYDYQHVEERRKLFLGRTTANSLNEDEPWKHLSAAIGIALYDPKTDSNVDDVSKRADQEMYRMKAEMKAFREDSEPV